MTESQLDLPQQSLSAVQEEKSKETNPELENTLEPTAANVDLAQLHIARITCQNIIALRSRGKTETQEVWDKTKANIFIQTSTSIYTHMTRTQSIRNILPTDPISHTRTWHSTYTKEQTKGNRKAKRKQNTTKPLATSNGHAKGGVAITATNQFWNYTHEPTCPKIPTGLKGVVKIVEFRLIPDTKQLTIIGAYIPPTEDQETLETRI